MSRPQSGRFLRPIALSELDLQPPHTTPTPSHSSPYRRSHRPPCLLLRSTLVRSVLPLADERRAEISKLTFLHIHRFSTRAVTPQSRSMYGPQKVSIGAVFGRAPSANDYGHPVDPLADVSLLSVSFRAPLATLQSCILPVPIPKIADRPARYFSTPEQLFNRQNHDA